MTSMLPVNLVVDNLVSIISIRMVRNCQTEEASIIEAGLPKEIVGDIVDEGSKETFVVGERIEVGGTRMSVWVAV